MLGPSGAAELGGAAFGGGADALAEILGLAQAVLLRLLARRGGGEGLGQSLAQHASGAGSALLGGGQFALGAAIAPVVGASGTGSPFPMAVIMLCAYALCGLVWFSLARPAQQ